MSRTNQDDVIQASTPLELEVLFRDGKESKMTGSRHLPTCVPQFKPAGPCQKLPVSSETSSLQPY
jgi:hypothetical protein